MATQFAHSVKRVTISGTSFNGAEIWSTGFYVGAVSADVSNPTQSFADAIRTAWTTFFQNANVGVATAWKTDNVKVAQISATGVTSESNVVYAPYGTAISGGGPVSPFPPQISMVASLENAGARGLAAKGRMYLPGISHTLQTNGTVATVTITPMVTALKTFLDAVNTAAPTGEDVILASQGNRVKDAEGKYQPVPGTAVNAVVNRVRIGSVYDTQRRRRNAMVETYQSATLA